MRGSAARVRIPGMAVRRVRAAAPGARFPALGHEPVHDVLQKFRAHGQPGKIVALDVEVSGDGVLIRREPGIVADVLNPGTELQIVVIFGTLVILAVGQGIGLEKGLAVRAETQAETAFAVVGSNAVQGQESGRGVGQHQISGPGQAIREHGFQEIRVHGEPGVVLPVLFIVSRGRGLILRDPPGVLHGTVRAVELHVIIVGATAEITALGQFVDFFSSLARAVPQQAVLARTLAAVHGQGEVAHGVVAVQDKLQGLGAGRDAKQNQAYGEDQGFFHGMLQGGIMRPPCVVPSSY